MEYFSKLWSVKLGDFGRALVVAVLAGPLGILYDWAINESVQINWRSLLKGAVAGGLAYLIKNFATGSGGKVLSDRKDDH